ncbi:cell wall hydrolase [Litorimonas sp. RW-G-Af-16]|uniref:cell wall hydrolase n=1 Tax=Litorimonas sp. RW-G-Af-16 TaxID=3241168 RepID=UPI00390CA494
MRNKRTSYAGWGLALFAIGTASVALPAVAGQAADLREASIWQDKAIAFQFQTLPVITTSELPTKLGEILTDSPLKADYAATEPFITLTSDLRRAASTEMAELQCLSEAIYYEARSESRSGQLAVAEVVHNRVKSKHYPNTICGVVYQGSQRNTGCQFSFTCDGSMDIAPKGRAWARSQSMAKVSMIGAHKRYTDRATHYHTVEVSPKWAPDLRFEKQIGEHLFYSYKWRERPAPVVTVSVAPPAP